MRLEATREGLKDLGSVLKPLDLIPKVRKGGEHRTGFWLRRLLPPGAVKNWLEGSSLEAGGPVRNCHNHSGKRKSVTRGKRRTSGVRGVSARTRWPAVLEGTGEGSIGGDFLIFSFALGWLHSQKEGFRV